MWEVFFTTSGETIALFTSEDFAKKYVGDMRTAGYPVDYDRE